MNKGKMVMDICDQQYHSTCFMVAQVNNLLSNEDGSYKRHIEVHVSVGLPESYRALTIRKRCLT